MRLCKTYIPKLLNADKIILLTPNQCVILFWFSILCECVFEEFITTKVQCMWRSSPYNYSWHSSNRSKESLVFHHSQERLSNSFGTRSSQRLHSGLKIIINIKKYSNLKIIWMTDIGRKFHLNELRWLSTYFHRIKGVHYAMFHYPCDSPGYHMRTDVVGWQCFIIIGIHNKLFVQWCLILMMTAAF